MGKYLCAVMILVVASFPVRETRADPPRTVVLFDQAHGQQFLVEKGGDLDLSGLARVFQGHGLTVVYRRDPLTPASLDAAGALVISGPFAPYGEGEIAAVKAFLEKGGRLAVMLHIGQPLVPLLQTLGVTVSRGVIHEGENFMGSNPLDFHVTRLGPHPLHIGLVSYALYGAWGLEAEGGKAGIIARTGPGAWIGTGRDPVRPPDTPVGEVGVAAAGRVGKGSFVVFGDDAIFQNRFLKEGNLSLAVNLARWLTGS